MKSTLHFPHIIRKFYSYVVVGIVVSLSLYIGEQHTRIGRDPISINCYGRRTSWIRPWYPQYKKYERELFMLGRDIALHTSELRDRVRRNAEEMNENNLASVDSLPNRSSNEIVKSHGLIYGTATYIRWGRSDCPDNNPLTDMLYSGQAAGTHYSHGGGGSNYICIYGNITYDHGHYVEGNQGSSHIYGLEYRDGAWIYPLFDLSDVEKGALQFHSVPCALCMNELRMNQIMIPGRETCPHGWEMEYSGYIMAGSHGDVHTSKFICVDERPQVISGTQANDKGAFLFMVEPQCTSLVCEPYVTGRELRCVVCTF